MALERMEPDLGVIVRARKHWRRNWKGAYRVAHKDRYAVRLDPLRGQGKPLYFGPKTFWKYWEHVYRESS